MDENTKPKCPYTRLKNFLHNIGGMFDPVAHAENMDALVPWADMSSVAVIKNLVLANASVIIDVPNHAASTVRGNLPVTVFIGNGKDDTAAINDNVMGELHGVLRGTVGQLAKKFDKTTLSSRLQKRILTVEDEQSEYKAHGDLLKKEVDQLLVEGGHVGIEYGDLDDLLLKMDECRLPHSKAFDARLKDMDALDRSSGKLLKKVDRGLKNTTYIGLKGISTPVRNTSFTNSSTIAQWFYYAEWGAKTFADTLKMTNNLSNKLSDHLSNTKSIVTDLCDGIEATPSLHRPVIADVFDNAVMKARQRFVQCASYVDMNQSETLLNLMTALDITSLQGFEDVLKTAPVTATTRKASDKKCPYGFGSQPT